MKKNFLFTCLLNLSMCNIIYAQTEREFAFSTGPVFQRFQDSRHSSIFRNATGVVNGGLSYRYGKKHYNKIGLNFATGQTNQQFASSERNMYFNLCFEQLRQIKSQHQVQIGGFVDLGGILQFRSGNWFDAGTGMSYGFWSSFGLAARKSFQWGKNWQASIAARTPLLAYVVRPAYGFPYPPSFLKEGRFSFELDNVGTELLKSGEIQTIHQFANLQISPKISKNFGTKQHELGVGYQFNYLFFSGVKPMAGFQHQVSLQFNLKLGNND